MEQHPIEHFSPNEAIMLLYGQIFLFTSPFFRDSYCLYPLWNSSHSKKLRPSFKKHMVL